MHRSRQCQGQWTTSSSGGIRTLPRRYSWCRRRYSFQVDIDLLDSATSWLMVMRKKGYWIGTAKGRGVETNRVPASGHGFQGIAVTKVAEEIFICFRWAKEFSDRVRDALKLEMPWWSTSVKEFGKNFSNASHLWLLPQYEDQQRIIKKQRTGSLRCWENVNPNPMWNDEMGDSGKGMMETKWEEDAYMKQKYLDGSKRDGRGVPAAIIAMASEGGWPLRGGWFQVTPGFLVRYQGSVAYHPVHSALNVAMKAVASCTVREESDECWSLVYAGNGLCKRMSQRSVTVTGPVMLLICLCLSAPDQNLKHPTMLRIYQERHTPRKTILDTVHIVAGWTHLVCRTCVHNASQLGDECDVTRHHHSPSHNPTIDDSLSRPHPPPHDRLSASHAPHTPYQKKKWQ